MTAMNSRKQKSQVSEARPMASDSIPTHRDDAAMNGAPSMVEWLEDAGGFGVGLVVMGGLDFCGEA